MDPCLTDTLQQILAGCRRNPSAFAVTERDKKSHRIFLTRRLLREVSAFDLGTVMVQDKQGLPGWTALGVLFLSEWVGARRPMAQKHHLFEAWLHPLPGSIIDSNATRAALEKYWDQPMAWDSQAGLDGPTVTAHGLWGLAHVAHEFSVLMARRSSNDVPERQLFDSLPLKDEDIPSLMATAQVVLGYPGGSPRPWRLQLAEELLCMITQAALTVSPQEVSLERQMIARAWHNQSAQARLDQLTQSYAYLKKNETPGLMPRLYLNNDECRIWFTLWAIQLDRAQREGAVATPEDVQVHLSFLKSTVDHAANRSQAMGMAVLSQTGSIAVPALKTLRAWLPEQVDPAPWIGRYQKVANGDEVEALQALALWQEELAAGQRADRTPMLPANATPTRARQRP